MILKDHKRPDGRAIDQIRPLAAEVDLIPRVHGSAMFTRGQTQICTIYDTGSSVRGTETGWTGRGRDIQSVICITITSRHTLWVRQDRPEDRDVVRLATELLRSAHLYQYFRSESEFPYAIRTVSETFESNGSTSQATTCASLCLLWLPVYRLKL